MQCRMGQSLRNLATHISDCSRLVNLPPRKIMGDSVMMHKIYTFPNQATDQWVAKIIWGGGIGKETEVKEIASLWTTSVST